MTPASEGSQGTGPSRSCQVIEFLIPLVHFYLNGCHRHIGTLASLTFQLMELGTVALNIMWVL